ncbi:MAG: hypothetical protein ACKV1O_14100 [Saprospiraceae bacterium]
MARENQKKYIPYVFLMKGEVGQSEYEVFICIIHGINEKVVDLSTESTMYINGTTALKFEIIQAEDAEAGKFYKRVSLDPNSKAIAGDYTFDPVKFCVQVNTERKEMVDDEQVTLRQSIKVFYEAADENTGETGQIAFDCPYLYLVNPHEVTGREFEEYEPYCLVPLKEFKINIFSQLSVNPADGIPGQFRQEITLEALAIVDVDDTSNINGIDTNTMTRYRELDPASIEANDTIYLDPETIEGWTEVIVNPLSTPGRNGKKRRGRLSNVSSDTNPTSFIDSPFG